MRPRYFSFPESSRPIPVDGGIKAKSKRGVIGERWWSRRFIAVLESYGMSGRLQRGRNYARRGQVIEFELRQGRVTARVQGSRPQPYKVVFDLTSDDPLDQAAVLRWLREVGTVNPETDMEVVMYGRGPSMVVAGRSTIADDVKQAIARPRVSFRVCEIAMQNQKIEKSQLLPNVGTVPDGIGEIVAKQREGWGYIKVVAH